MSQAERDVVGECDGLVLTGDLVDRGDRTEQFFLGHRRLRIDTGEHRRGEMRAGAFTRGIQCRTGLHGLLDLLLERSAAASDDSGARPCAVA